MACYSREAEGVGTVSPGAQEWRQSKAVPAIMCSHNILHCFAKYNIEAHIVWC